MNKNEIPHRIHKFKVRILDFEAGKNIAILNEDDAIYNDIYLSDRISIKYKSKEVIAIIDLSKTMVKKGEIAIYKDVADQLKIKNGEEVEIQHVPIPKSLEYIKKKMDKETLKEDEVYTIIKETVENRLSEGELASFVAAAYINGFGISETVALSKAMVDTGQTLDLNVHPIADKHCLAGNTPVIVKNSGKTKVSDVSEIIESVFERSKPDEIIEDDGAFYTEKNLNGLEVLTFDENGKVRFAPVKGVFKAKAPPEMYEISLIGNRKITVTSDHTVFVLRKGRIVNVMASKLNTNDHVVVPSTVSEEKKDYDEHVKIGDKKIKLTKEFMRFIGYYLSEGFVNYQGVFLNFGSHEKKLINDAEECIKKVFGRKITINKPHETATRICIYDRKLAQDFESLNIGTNALEKRIPHFIFEAPKELKIEFIKALFAGDGYVRRGYEAIYVTSSKELAIGLQYLLSLMGMSVTMAEKEETTRIFKTKKGEVTSNINKCYYIYTQAREIFGGREKSNVAYTNLLPTSEIGEIEDIDKRGVIGWILRKALKKQRYITKQKLLKIIDKIKSEDVKKLLNGDISVIKIKRIRKIKSPSEWTYDFRVDGPSRFFAGTAPVCVHNCIGGVAGNRTTMLIVPILAAAGIYIPKTSSRAISSASGTADTFEVLAPVVLPIDELRQVVLKTKGCIAWGGAINLAPVDDKLIRIRNSLHLDPKGLLLSSILAKKKAVGAEYLVVDIPVGRGAKIEDENEGKMLANDFLQISEQLGIKTRCLITDGSDPIGFGVGPGLEVLEVYKSLTLKDGGELREKSCLMAGSILELVGKAPPGKGAEIAFNLVKNGKAFAKLKEIIEAQGGNPNFKESDIPIGKYVYEVRAEKSGRVSHVDNGYINKIARVAGAPKDKGAGIRLHCEKGDKVNEGDVLYEIIAESESKLSFAIKMAEAIPPIELQKVIIGKIE
jgi:putative thymidine phosphorylase